MSYQIDRTVIRPRFESRFYIRGTTLRKVIPLRSTAKVGDIWWLPEEHARFPGGKDRFCLVVALEGAPAATVPGRAHYIVGSTKRGGSPEIVLEAGEANLRQRTYFRFWWSGDIDISTLAQAGRYRGSLKPSRLDEIVVAIRASKRIALQRLVG